MNENAEKKRVARNWVSTFVYVISFVLALIAYGDLRNRIMSVIGDWELGFFEGVIIASFIFILIKQYGSDIHEVLSGLRELAHQRKDRLEKEQHPKDTQN